jgi:hypothetical protein
MADTAEVDVADLARRGLSPDQIVAEVQAQLGMAAQDAWAYYWMETNQWDGDPIEEPA